MLDILIITGIYWIPMLFMKISKLFFGISDAEHYNEKQNRLESDLKKQDPQIRYNANTVWSREQIAGAVGLFVWFVLLLWAV